MRTVETALRVMAATLVEFFMFIYMCGIVWMGIRACECDAKHNSHIKKT